MPFPAPALVRKHGTEPFHAGSSPLDFQLLHFWQWAASDLASNTLRGRIAEFLVARALGLDTGIRVEWDACDLQVPDGPKIEVKSASYIQSWAQKAPSTIKFRIRPTLAWDRDTNEFGNDSRRQADIYVFALLTQKDRNLFDVMDVSQWCFYLLKKEALNRSGKTISLTSLLKLKHVNCTFDQLKHAIGTI
jgi:hypothetical protein